jgi:polyisoprenoid-binding protein YceI
VISQRRVSLVQPAVPVGGASGTAMAPSECDRALTLRRAWRWALGSCRAWAIALVAATPMTPSARAADYALDAGHTFVHWEVLHMGTSTSRGRFEALRGVVNFDPAQQKIDVSITVDTASVSTGFAAFDTVLRGAQLLDVQQFPQAYFTATQARWDGEVPRELLGEITLRGVSQALRLRAVRWKCGLNLLFKREVCGGDFEGTLLRSDFGMTLALPLVANEVVLRVQVEGIRQ